MSVGSECGIRNTIDIIRQNRQIYRDENSYDMAPFFNNHFQKQFVYFMERMRHERSILQQIFEPNLKQGRKILCLPDPQLPRQLLLTSPKKFPVTLMLQDAHLNPQLLLPLPQNFSPILFLMCSNDIPQLLLPKPSQFDHEKSRQKNILAIFSKLFGNIFKYKIWPFITHGNTLRGFFLRICLFNEFFNKPELYFNLLEEITGISNQVSLLNIQLPVKEEQCEMDQCSPLELPQKSFFEILSDDFRLSFKVQPPALGRKRWVLSLFMQSREDPSLLIPIEHLIKPKDQENETRILSSTTYELPSSIDRKDVHPYIEEDLKTLAKIFQPFGQFERNVNRIKVYLSIEQTYTFLKKIVPKLRDQSYGVLIPDWWGKQDSQLGLKIKLEKKNEVRDVNHSLLGANAQLEYNWQVSVGKMSITLKEFAYLVSLKEPLVKWNNKWIEMESKEIQYLTEFIQSNKSGKKKKKRNKISLRQSLKLTIGKNRLEEGVRVVDVEAGKGLNKIFDQFQQPKHIKPIPTPKTFNGTLRSYQQTGLSWMTFMHQFQFGVCLADDMGLGKTIQILAFLLHQQEKHQEKIHEYKLQGKCKRQKILSLGPSLVVCPLSLINNWVQEIEKFAPSLRVYVHHGNSRVGGKAFVAQLANSNIVITTYYQVKRNKNLLAKVLWENIILDEAQNIKNYHTHQTKAIKILKSNFRIGLTGTPIENRLRELWSIMDFLNPGFFGTLHSFHTQYCVPIEKSNDQARLAELQQILNPFILRRLKNDNDILPDLPNKYERTIYVDLTLEQATLYQAIVEKLEEKLESVEGFSRSGIILSTLLKLKQVCNHPAQFLHEKNPWTLEDENTAHFYQDQFPNRSGKLKKITGMLQKIIEKGEKAVIFTQYTQMGKFLQSYISKTLQTDVLYLNGSTPSDDRDFMVRQFHQPNQNQSIFILSLKAGGLGLNLTAANHAFHYDRWWNPAVEDQASDRIYRIGQKRDVTITKFVSIGTIEEKIDLMITKKKQLSKNILNSGMKWISKMSTEELKKLLILGNNLNSPVANAI